MSRTSLVLVIVALAGCDRGTELTRPAASTIGPVLAERTAPPRYEIVTLPLLTGTVARGNSINDRGWVAGYSNLAGDLTRHATLWRNGEIEDLKTLGGPNSSVVWPGQNERGAVVGIAETAAIDSLGEAWSCSAFFPGATGHVCRGFFWNEGAMRALPTLGGTNGFATGINDRGRVVGWAETPVHDPTCNSPQVLQFRAVVWYPETGRLRELRPLTGDSASAATAINDRGQIVGISGACDVAVGRFSARRAVLWERGRVIDIGGLGGVAWNTPMAINDAGVVVGFADLTGDQDGTDNFHAFLWTREGGIKDLKTLPGDVEAEALSINARRQVVGVSIGAAGTRAFIWQDGVMTDLQTLLPPGYPNTLLSAQSINDEGQITGRLLDQSTGKKVAFVATPTRSGGEVAPH